MDSSRWRLLRVNFDTLALYAKAVKIADLLAYQNAVSEACRRVKQLVEEEYPLGNEIYRDSTGIYFTFPDLPLPAELEQEIRRLVEDGEPELAPRIAVTEGQNGATAQDQLKTILGKARGEALETLKQPFDASNLTSCWQQLWETVSREKKWEVCPVCRLRPKEEYAEVCIHCEGRRTSRLGAWKKKPDHTIWVGEIADHNDRLALLVGKFGLNDWLSGDLVQTMLVKADPAANTFTPKYPSPARLRRVWETCQRFWGKTVEGEILASHNYGAQADHADLRRARYLLTPDRSYGWRENFPYNGTIEVKHDGKTAKHPISLLWQPDENAFLTISDLQIIGKLEKGQSVTVRDSDKPRSAEHTFRVQQPHPAQGAFASYQPYLPLHASPDQFLALVPAADALDIVLEIRKQYEEQFGKVRNRLPLFLGLVYFERKMPLLAVMDAARQMLEQHVNSEQWTVNRVDGSGHVEFENGISWDVKTVMDDGSTPDDWYPYFELDGAPAAHHTHRFQHNGKTWAHVKNLQTGDQVCVTPSRFDFLWLDAASRRFEIHYENGHRPAQPTRPYYLEDLARLNDLWDLLFRCESTRLRRTQLKQTLQTIETARERWFGRDEERQSARQVGHHSPVFGNYSG